MEAALVSNFKFITKNKSLPTKKWISGFNKDHGIPMENRLISIKLSITLISLVITAVIITLIMRTT